MFNRLVAPFALAVVIMLANFQSASSQDSYHGYLIDSNAPVGTSWVATNSTPLWPLPQDSGFAQILTVPRGAVMTATSGFNPTATGVYLQVNYNGVSGWIDERFIRQGTGGARNPVTNVASGITYNVINVNNWASLRQRNSTQSRRLARVPRGAVVVTTGQQVQSGGLTWLSVSYNGVQGWMPARYLGQGGGVVTPAPNNPVNNGSGGNGAYPTGQYRIINVDNWASLRVSPSRSAGRVTKMPRGSVVDHYGERSRAGGELWLKVVSGGYTGWMPVQYLGLN
ncbi:MAG: SH3 domain-containing protein [Hyphomicrobiales bacterium]